MIDVFCGDPSHMPRRFSWPLSRDENGIWRPDGEVNDPIAQWPKGFEMQLLTAETMPHAHSGPDRFKYRFRCDWCHYTVPARGEKLTHILDTLDAHGVPSLSLVDLAATISRYGMTAQ